jgi:hypothetical protein
MTYTILKLNTKNDRKYNAKLRDIPYKFDLFNFNIHTK